MPMEASMPRDFEVMTSTLTAPVTRKPAVLLRMQANPLNFVLIAALQFSPRKQLFYHPLLAVHNLHEHPVFTAVSVRMSLEKR